MWSYSALDFSEVARAYRIESLTVSDTRSLPAAIDKMWAKPREPFLLQVSLDVSANAYPSTMLRMHSKIAFGHPMTEMEPFARPLEMEGT